jgi:hypothetical protein
LIRTYLTGENIYSKDKAVNAVVSGIVLRGELDVAFGDLDKLRPAKYG